MKTFQELGVDERILKAITELGFERAMPVQEEVLPVLLSKETDLVALAQTGTGKTAAFGIPTIQKLDYSNSHTEALVLCPTRELCMQITKDLENYSKYIPECTVVAVYGGASIEMQKKALNRGAKIIVATPGRMLDLLKRGYVKLGNLRWAILDEADEMLDMGFKEDLDIILSKSPETKHTLLFSATMPQEVARIAKNYMDKPIEITIGVKNSGSENIRHYYYLVHAKDRYLALKRIADYYPDIYSIIFCRTRAETQEVSNMLIRDGYNADALHGDLSQAQRDQVMNRFRVRNIQMLVATDVAARGLDVNDLTHVINYNLPDEIEQYNHRSGRTGRADKQGISIAILNLREKHKIRLIEKTLGKKFTQMPIPTGEEICEKQLFKMIENIEKIDVIEDEINDYLPVIYKKLETMDKKELIQRFVSVEFNRFLDYYRSAPDLNIDEKKEALSEERNRGAKSSNNKRGSFGRIFISLGHKDKVNPQRLIGLVNDFTNNREVVIGHIDILDTFSYVEIDELHVKEVEQAFDGANYRGRPLRVEIASEARPQSRYGRDNRGGGGRGGSSSSSKSSYGKDRGDRGGDRGSRGNDNKGDRGFRGDRNSSGNNSAKPNRGEGGGERKERRRY